MEISSRFKDYGLTGGFFWALNSLYIALFLGLSALLGFGQQIAGFETLLAKIPSATIPAQAAILAAIALVIIIITGLLLDLLSALMFGVFEARMFALYMRQNVEWTLPLFLKHKAYLGDSWKILHKLSPPREITLRSMPIAIPINACIKAWQKLIKKRTKRVRRSLRSRWVRWKLAWFGGKRRREELLIAQSKIYALLEAIAERRPTNRGKSTLANQTSLYHVSRSVAFAMIGFYLEMPLLLFPILYLAFTSHLKKWFDVSLLTHPDHVLLTIAGEFVILAVPSSLLLKLSRSIMESAHKRLSATLFAEAYLASLEPDKSNSVD